MPLRNTFKGLNRIALYIVGENGINDAPSADRGALSAVVQYWGNQANVSAIFATVFSSISIAFLIQPNYNFLSIPSFVCFLYFLIRAWAFNRCAAIACSCHK